jgi:hypothetical protein
MFNKFRHSIIRKSVVAFGNLFNNLYVDRVDETERVIQTIKVPLSYAPKQKFIAKKESTPNSFEQEFQTILPRMSFEMSGIGYDPLRKVSTVQKIKRDDPNGGTISQFVPVPYNINMNLYIYSKNQEDGLQILEQIIVYFNPDYNLNLKSMTEFELIDDMPVILNNINYEDNYESNFEERRFIVWTLTFTLKLNFYGPITKSGVIKRVVTNMFSDEEMEKGIIKYTAEINPFSANKTDEYEIVEKFEGF